MCIYFKNFVLFAFLKLFVDWFRVSWFDLRFWLRKWDFLMASDPIPLQETKMASVSCSFCYIVVMSIMGLHLHRTWPDFNWLNVGCSYTWNKIEQRIATLEFDRDRKSMGVITTSPSGRKSLLVKVCSLFPWILYYDCLHFWFDISWHYGLWKHND